MAIFNGERPEWGKHFSVDNGDDEGFIRLPQRTDTHFKLESHIMYGGATGLETIDGGLSDASWDLLRSLEPADLTDTDLASIPAPMRWWIDTYGRHTPAALIHDRFIGIPEGLPRPLRDDGIEEHHINRCFRFMLGDAGIPFTDRWIMWSAVALRTRWKSTDRRRALLVVWFVAALSGLGGLIWAIGTGNLLIGAACGVAPLPAAWMLWGKQWGAGIVAAYIVFPLLLATLYILRRWFSRAIEGAARMLFGGQIEPAFYADDAVSTPRLERRGAVVSSKGGGRRE